MSKDARPEIDPYPESQNTGADFTATASPDAWQTLTDSLARIEQGWADRDAREGR